MAMASTDDCSGEWEDDGGMTYQMRNQVRIDECKRENEAMSSISVRITFGGITDQLSRFCMYIPDACK